MSADAIAQSLNEHYSSDNIYFQIVEHGGVLHVYLNHASDNSLNYAPITERIQGAVASQWQGSEDGFWFYSRTLGRTQPDWQSYIQIPRQFTGRHISVAGASSILGMPQETAITNLAGSSTYESTEDREAPTEFVSLTGKFNPYEASTDMISLAGEADLEDENTDMVSLTGKVQSEDDPTEMVFLTGEVQLEDDPTEMVHLQASYGQQSSFNPSPSFEGNYTDNEQAETEMVLLSSTDGNHSLTASPFAEDGGDEHEVIPLSRATPSKPSQVPGGTDEEVPTELVSLGNPTPNQFSTLSQFPGGTDEEATTELVSVGRASQRMSSFSPMANDDDEDAATEMVSIGDVVASGQISAANVMPEDADENASTEMVSLGNPSANRLSTKPQVLGVQEDDDENAPTEILSAGIQPSQVTPPLPAKPKVDAQTLAQTLERQFQAEGIRFQVAKQERFWYVCANRLADRPLDFIQTGDRVRRTLIELGLENDEAFWFYSRVAGQKKPERKHLIQFAENFAVRQRQNNISTVGTISSMGANASRTTSTSSTSAPTAPHGTKPNLGIPPTAGSSVSHQPTDLSQFCFVRNQLLLKTQLFPPSNEVARLIQCFHELPNSEQLQAAKSLALIFKGQQILTKSPPWMLELERLSDPDLRIAALWFSRYCMQPVETYSQLEAILKPSSFPAPTPDRAPNTHPQPASGYEAALATAPPEAAEPKLGKGSHWFCRKIKALFSRDN
ncbi:MAG: hypothetical protein AB4040_05535 [Synechococcus sp.]